MEPIFVYGSLLSDGNRAELLKPFTIHRETASVMGTLDHDRYPFPRARFRFDAQQQVDGELVFLDPDRHEEALIHLDRYEGHLFRRVTVPARVGGGEIVMSYAYEWNESADYFHACRRKLELANYHFQRLSEEMDATGGGQVTIPIQAHFEGVLFCAFAAQDQLAEGIRRAEGDHLSPPPRRTRGTELEKVLAQLAEAESGGRRSFVEELTAWVADTLLQDARGVRRMATHHHYEKGRTRDRVVVMEVSEGGYDGDREIRAYSKAVVRHLDVLETHLTLVEAEYETSAGAP